ncbi:uncharacterized protein LOC143017889 [Oratosquilla oratoria]|uniref:uncharacterized protein LOC143017889 n=1 Tax=Oratosquilla oratoria TaxID=337810 RepID=UPI003F764ABB
MTIKEDKDFLMVQREKGRWGSMAGHGKKLEAGVHRRETTAARGGCEWSLMAEETVELESSLSSSSSPVRPSSTSSSGDEGASSPKQVRMWVTKMVMSPDLVGVLDWTGVSSHQDLRIVATTASSLGHDAQELVLNPKSIRKARAKYWALLAGEIKEAFIPQTPLTIHWDNKIVFQDDGSWADQLAIIVTDKGVEKLMGVPKLCAGTGKAAATAVFECLEDWGISNCIIGMCFNTSANTSNINGACTLLQEKMERPLFLFTYYHHMHELLVEKAFASYLGPSSGSEISLFLRFKKYWQFIDRSAIQPLSDLSETLAAKKEAIIKSLNTIMIQKQSRDDYRELAELNIAFLGGALPKMMIRRPGALHPVQWMAHIFYSLKMLFREQITSLVMLGEIAGLKHFSFFISEVYVIRWFESMLPAYAPANDLQL